MWRVYVPRYWSAVVATSEEELESRESERRVVGHAPLGLSRAVQLQAELQAGLVEVRQARRHSHRA